MAVLIHQQQLHWSKKIAPRIDMLTFYHVSAVKDRITREFISLCNRFVLLYISTGRLVLITMYGLWTSRYLI